MLSQVEGFKYLGLLFKCEGRDTLGLYWSVTVNRELNLQVKLLIYRSIYIPMLTYGHMHWVVTARKRWQAQNSLSLKAGWYFPYWEGEVSHLGGSQTRAATPQHQKDPVQVVQSYDRDASWVPPEWGVPEEAPRSTLNILERYLSASLGMVWFSPGATGGAGWGEGAWGDGLMEINHPIIRLVQLSHQRCTFHDIL